MRERQKSPGKRAICVILMLFFGAQIVVGGLRIHALLAEYARGEAAYAGLEEYVVPPTPKPSGEPMEDEIAWPEVDFQSLAEINPDIVGWLVIEGTNVNYPIVQAEDNDFYLTHLFTGEWNGAGCLFLNAGNSPDFTDPNSVVYGHHLKNGTMFASLVKYKEQAFYDDHPTALLLTPEKNYLVRFFSGFVSGVDGKAWETSFPDETAHTAWLEEVGQKSAFVPEVVPTSQNRVLTLSTCTYEFNNARFVLLGVLEERE